MVWVDIITFLIIIGLWAGYSYFEWAHRDSSIMGYIDGYRKEWMTQMLKRELRMVDTGIVTMLGRSNTMFASTSVAIMAAIITVMASYESVYQAIGGISYSWPTSKLTWDIKFSCLLFVIVYGFFKFIWSLRQFNFAAVMIGAAPDKSEANTAEAKKLAVKTARLLEKGMGNFTLGLRSYYFAIALLAWIFHPLLGIIAATMVVVTLYRREFYSKDFGLRG